MPTVVFGPGRIEDAHSAGEKIDMADVLTAAETLVLFIERWCGLVPDS
jgi:acetylornithine deacetylase